MRRGRRPGVCPAPGPGPAAPSWHIPPAEGLGKIGAHDVFCDFLVRSHTKVTSLVLSPPRPPQGVVLSKDGPRPFCVITEPRTWARQQALWVLSCRILRPTSVLCGSAQHFPHGCDANSKGAQPGEDKAAFSPGAASSSWSRGRVTWSVARVKIPTA